MTEDWYKEMADALNRRDRALAAIEKWNKALNDALDEIEGLRITRMTTAADETPQPEPEQE